MQSVMPPAIVCCRGEAPWQQSTVVVSVTGTYPIQAMTGPPLVQQKYRDVREGEMPGEGIALAGGLNVRPLSTPRGADAIELGPSARRFCRTRIERLAGAAQRVTIFVEASHLGLRAESA